MQFLDLRWRMAREKLQWRESLSPGTGSWCFMVKRNLWELTTTSWAILSQISWRRWSVWGVDLWTSEWVISKFPICRKIQIYMSLVPHSSFCAVWWWGSLCFKVVGHLYVLGFTEEAIMVDKYGKSELVEGTVDANGKVGQFAQSNLPEWITRKDLKITLGSTPTWADARYNLIWSTQWIQW